VGHNGAVYGFATCLSAMPEQKLGVALAATRDCAIAVTDRIGREALRMMRAAREGRPLPAPERTAPPAPEEALRWEGRWAAGDRAFELVERGGRLYLHRPEGEWRVALRKSGEALVVDDGLDYGQRLVPEGEALRVGEALYRRAPAPRPAEPPERWRGIIGEYGWDHNVLVVLEQDGVLCALIEWFFLYPLKEEGPDRFAFPDWGLYHGEKLLFRRGAEGRATEVEAAGVVFPRRLSPGETAETFRIAPVRPIEELRELSRRATPPPQAADLLAPDLVEPAALDASIKLDIRYAGTNNFLSAPLYGAARAMLQRPAAEALVRAHKRLEADGFGLLIHDAYRPWSVTWIFWEATPEPQRIFVADPSQGSRHNRGCAVDLTLYERATGRPVQMVGLYDEFGDRSWPDYPGGSSAARWRRELLRRAMEAEGFTVYENEWWHFDYRDWRRYPILNAPLER
jgi:D-alanyl-D-alanine dipeptidase